MSLYAIALCALGLGLIVGSLHGGPLFGDSSGPHVTAALPKVAAEDRTRVEAEPAQRPLAPAARRLMRVSPAHAQIRIDGAEVGTGSFVVPNFNDGLTHELRITAPGFITRVALFKETLVGDVIALSADPAPEQ